jgi:hypothetical protein
MDLIQNRGPDARPMILHRAHRVKETFQATWSISKTDPEDFLQTSHQCNDVMLSRKQQHQVVMHSRAGNEQHRLHRFIRKPDSSGPCILFSIVTRHPNTFDVGLVTLSVD